MRLWQTYQTILRQTRVMMRMFCLHEYGFELWSMAFAGLWTDSHKVISVCNAYCKQRTLMQNLSRNVQSCLATRNWLKTYFLRRRIAPYSSAQHYAEQHQRSTIKRPSPCVEQLPAIFWHNDKSCSALLYTSIGHNFYWQPLLAQESSTNKIHITLTIGMNVAVDVFGSVWFHHSR